MSPLLSDPINANAQEILDEIYLDIETVKLSHEVPGGWSNIKNFGLAVAVTWNLNNQFRVWFEPDATNLMAELHRFPRIVTFNGERFDLEVLRGYGEVRGLFNRSFDVLAHIYRTIGKRVKFDHVVSQTLGVHKSGDGFQSVEWWRKGERDKVIEYCGHDVELLIRLVAHARATGHIRIDGAPIRVNWSPLRAALTRAARAGR